MAGAFVGPIQQNDGDHIDWMDQLELNMQRDSNSRTCPKEENEEEEFEELHGNQSGRGRGRVIAILGVSK